MKLKEMEEMAKHSRKSSTREGSLLERTAMSFFTCRSQSGRGGREGRNEQGGA